METALHAQRSFCCGARNFSERSTRLEAKPSAELFSIARVYSSPRLIPLYSWRKDCVAIGVSNHIIASADFSWRRRRKGQIPRPKGPAPKGLVPKSRVGTSTQKREKSETGDKVGSSTIISGEYSGPSKKPTETKVGYGEDGDIDYAPGKEQRRVENENEAHTTALTSHMLGAVRNETEENGRIAGTNDDVTETPTPEIVGEAEEDEVDGSLFTSKHLDMVRSDTENGARLRRQLFGAKREIEEKQELVVACLVKRCKSRHVDAGRR